VTIAGTEQVSSGPEAGAFLGLSRRLAALGLAVLVALAFPFAGLPATFAVLVGGALAALAHLWLCRGLSELLRSGASAKRGRLWAMASLVPRQVLLAGALFVAVVPLALPAAWLLAGVTAWPVAFVAAAILSARLPAAALAASARPASEI